MREPRAVLALEERFSLMARSIFAFQSGVKQTAAVSQSFSLGFFFFFAARRSFTTRGCTLRSLLVVCFALLRFRHVFSSFSLSDSFVSAGPSYAGACGRCCNCCPRYFFNFWGGFALIFL